MRTVNSGFVSLVDETIVELLFARTVRNRQLLLYILQQIDYNYYVLLR